MRWSDSNPNYYNIQPTTWHIEPVYVREQLLNDNTLNKSQREDIIKATKETIRAFEPMLRNVLSQDCICALGNEEKLKANKDLFENIEKVIK